jgi:hypothetical protein
MSQEDEPIVSELKKRIRDLRIAVFGEDFQGRKEPTIDFTHKPKPVEKISDEMNSLKEKMRPRN